MSGDFSQESSKIQEIQILEHTLNQILMQKQAFDFELQETESALTELDSSGDDVYKIIGQLMLKTSKSLVKEELENKKKILELRTKNLEKQENQINDKIDSLKKDIPEFSGEKL
ncbi:MAG: prefoldin subunit beta [Nanoarchaeota archaeon]|nr:prefoldin subunit beta [Nanoarchaeota archaeon]